MKTKPHITRKRGIWTVAVTGSIKIEHYEAAQSYVISLNSKQWLAKLLQDGPQASGVCCCGEPMHNHGYDGSHLPLDSGEHLHSARVARAREGIKQWLQ